jgi:hypothetical protein
MKTKSKKRSSGRKSYRRKRSYKKQKGGTCYGRGIGANSYEPNYSIYNTNLLKLFPYKS